MLIYTDLVRQIVEDIAQRVRDFQHIDPGRLAILATGRFSGQSTGNLATCYGLGRDYKPTFSIWTRPRSRTIIAVSEWFQYHTPRIRLGGHEPSYLIMLRLPRLLLRNPLPILVHELYHINEKFDQTMRPVRHGAHFNREVRRITAAWLDAQRGALAQLGQMKLHDLEKEFSAVLALGVPYRFTLPLVERVDLPAPGEADVRRLYPGYTLAPRYAVRPAPVSADDMPRTLADKDLVLRHYHRTGSERVPAALMRYTRRHLALSA